MPHNTFVSLFQHKKLHVSSCADYNPKLSQVTTGSPVSRNTSFNDLRPSNNSESSLARTLPRIRERGKGALHFETIMKCTICIITRHYYTMQYKYD
jgi:hypothetical protein